ncbi:MAG: septum site-determining protein MinC [Desulfococcus multivorans]|jgi:septum site-determining protein MinC|nr:septum site-determining protein MinC [Desulfococcus multivorans]
MDQKEAPPVKLKGVGDSLWVSVDPSLPVEQLKQELVIPFERLQHLAVNARIIIDTGRDDAEIDRLIETLGVFLKAEFQVGHVSKPNTPRQTANENRIRQQDMGNAWHHYRNDGLVIAGRVRSGQKIQAKKHLIILGDLNPGAEVTAGGDIIVMGCLQGKAAAGQPDNEGAIIVALDFKPTQIQIGGFVAAGMADAPGNRPEFACVEGNAIVVDDYIKGNPFRRLAWPEVR